MDRYAYVNNSPVNYTDPSGHKCVGDADECDALQGDIPQPDVPLTQVGDPIPGTDETMIYGGNEFALLYDKMASCTACWWYMNGSFTFEQFVGLLLLHEGSGDFLYSMLNAFAGAQQLFVGGGGKGAFGPYCPPGPCHNGVFNYFAAFSQSARGLVKEYVRKGTAIQNYTGFGGRGITDPGRTINDANLYGSAMLHPTSWNLSSTRGRGTVTWHLDTNANTGLSNYGFGYKDVINTLIDKGLRPYTYYPGGNQGIYYFTDGSNGNNYAIWLSVNGEQTWLP